MTQIADKTSSEVLCSGGKGRVTKTECMACALQRDNRCGFDYAMLKAMFADKERTGIHATDLTGCLRRAYYEKTIPPLEYVHTGVARYLGTAVHKSLESADDEHVRSEMELAAHGIVGTADVVYRDGRIVDYKTTRWLTPARLPYGSHATQINVYAAMLRAQGHEVTSGAIQYIDLSGPTKCRSCKVPVVPDGDGIPVCPGCNNHPQNAHFGVMLIEIPLEEDVQVGEWIGTRRKSLEMSIEANEPPHREPGFLCGYCAYENICQEA